MSTIYPRMIPVCPSNSPSPPPLPQREAANYWSSASELDAPPTSANSSMMAPYCTSICASLEKKIFSIITASGKFKKVIGTLCNAHTKLLHHILAIWEFGQHNGIETTTLGTESTTNICKYYILITISTITAPDRNDTEGILVEIYEDIHYEDLTKFLAL